MELTINEKNYQLKASMDFIDAIEKTKQYKTASGELVEYGLTDAYVQLTRTGDVRALRDIIYYLNVGQTPRLQKTELNRWLSEDCEDPKELGRQIADFLYDQKLSALRLEATVGPKPTAKA